jgi:hypothetical protein
MADEAIVYLQRRNALVPDQPFFVQFAPGGVLTPQGNSESMLTVSNRVDRAEAAQQLTAGEEPPLLALRPILLRL